MPVKHSRTFLRFALIVGLACAFWCLALLPAASAQEGAAAKKPAPSTSEEETTPAPNPTPTEPHIRVQANIVTAPVTVINSKGEYVFDLQQQDFEVLDNGVEQRIEQFSLEQRTLDVVVVVEANTTTAPLLDEIHPLGPVFSSLMLGPQGQAAVLAYSDQVRVVQDFTQNGDELESALRGIEAQGGSFHLNDALARAIEMLETHPKEDRRIVVVFSDGHDIGSHTRKEEVVQRAVNAGITIYGMGLSPTRAMLAKQPKTPAPNPVYQSMGLPTAPNMAPTASNVQSTYDAPALPVVPLVLETGEMIRSIVAKDALEFYAGYTGGVYYGSWSKKPLQDELNRISSEIQSQYEIAYVPHAPSDNGFHRIEVHVDRNGVKVRTRAGYFMSGTNP